MIGPLLRPPSGLNVSVVTVINISAFHINMPSNLIK